jgi:hypothetical protein
MNRRGFENDAALTPTRTAIEPDIGALVHDLRNLYYGSGIELMLRIGELILERLYGGDVMRWHSRRRKDVSFRRLERHPDLPFKASMLSRAVSIYVLSRRRSDLTQLKNVSQTHLQEVLNLEPEIQDRLLVRVEQEKWSVRRLRSEVIECLPTAIRRAGRPRTPSINKQLRHLRAIADGRVLVLDPSNVAVLQIREAQDLLDIARRLCQQAEQAARVLVAHMESLERTRAEAYASSSRIRRATPLPPARGSKSS